MSSTPEKKPDLTALAEAYDIVGELGGRDHTRTYVGRRKEDGRDVLIAVMQAAADVAEGKAIAQFAADAKLLATLSHPNVPQVLDARWISDDAFALVSDRVHGTTLAEALAGDRISNPRIADILSDVDGVLEWARGERIVHRGVTPEGIVVERGTGKIYVALSPTEAPKTNRPDPRDDARTIGRLATTMLTAKPMADDHDGTLANMRPDLPQRVVEATEKLAAITVNDEPPDISAYLASVAMADAIKEGEVEVARVDAEFRAAMNAEREKWEAEQHASQLASEEQARKFAEERAEYERRAAKEREQLATARMEIDKRRAEVQQARAELDQARGEFKQKKSELEARVREIDGHARALEKQKRELEKHARDLEKRKSELERKNTELAAAASAAAAAATVSGTSIESLKARLMQPVQRQDEIDEPELEEVEDEVAVSEEMAAASLAGGIESVEDIHEPWTPIEETEPWSVPLQTDDPVAGISYEAAALPEPEKKSGRPRWAVPAGVAGILLLLMGTAVAINRRHAGQPVVPLLATRPTVSAGTPAASVTDSAAGVVAPVGLADSVEFNAIRDSIIQADVVRREARLLRQQADSAAERERAAQTVTDSNGVKWTTVAPPTLDSVRRADSVARANAVRRDSTAAAKKDSAKTKPDTLVKPDTGSVKRM